MVADELEAKHDLLWSHYIVTELLVDIDDVRGVLAVHKHCVDFVEDHVDVVIEVVVAAGVDLTHRDHWSEQALSLALHHEIEARLNTEHLNLTHASRQNRLLKQESLHHIFFFKIINNYTKTIHLKQSIIN